MKPVNSNQESEILTKIGRSVADNRELQRLRRPSGRKHARWRGIVWSRSSLHRDLLKFARLNSARTRHSIKRVCMRATCSGAINCVGDVGCESVMRQASRIEPNIYCPSADIRERSAFVRHYSEWRSCQEKIAVGTLELAMRLGAAALVGAAMDLNRDLHGKSTGVRTLGLVGLGSALAVLAFGQASSADASRALQGIVTGIGFLGAGVIVRSNDGDHVHGLTTAACVWLTACIGAACGASEWRSILLSLPFVLVILLCGGPFEKAIDRHWPRSTKTEADTY